jgi:xanthine dehydrogenase accessory factor
MMDDIVQDQARRCCAQAEAAVIVEVAATKGSAPREAGTRMLVSAQHAWGTVGGGHVEWQAIAQARQMLQLAEPGPALRHWALGPALGQCCGGTMDLRFERLTPAHLPQWPSAMPRFHLQLHGAGHVGQAIVRQLAQLPCQVQWIDEREEAFPVQIEADARERHIQRIWSAPATAEVARAPAGAFFLVLTHSHELDFDLALAISRRADFGFFGLIGSQTKRVRFERRLAERGIPTAVIQRMVCPIGLPGIAGKAPEVLALAVAAQLMLQQHATPAANAGAGPSALA